MPKSDWRVVGKDNHARESVADMIKIDCITQSQAEDFAKRLNDDEGEYASRWYVAQHRDVKLWRGMEELV